MAKVLASEGRLRGNEIHAHVEELSSFGVGNEALECTEQPGREVKSGTRRWRPGVSGGTERTFSTTCGNALRGIGSAFLRFRTLMV
jgi:hypothetical protein